ncbi:MAG: hypothetical protein ACR2ON_03285 [Paracoccaceae bacterium]
MITRITSTIITFNLFLALLTLASQAPLIAGIAGASLLCNFGSTLAEIYEGLDSAGVAIGEPRVSWLFANFTGHLLTIPRGLKFG